MTGEVRYSIGVDIGGTFTDCVLRDQHGRFIIDKAFTTPGELHVGVLQSLQNACAQRALDLRLVLASTDAFKVGTTSPVNRLINRAGAPTALITTRGHEDAVIIGRVQQKTDGLSDAERSDLRYWRKAEPLVPTSRIFGITERVDSSGSVLCAVDELEVEAVVRRALDDGVEAFAVCFLWSFMNPSNEQVVRKVLERISPSAFVVVSSEIAPVIGEYERAMTTILNAYLGPGTSADLLLLRSSLKDFGLSSEVFVMQSSGGVGDATRAVNRPVYLLGSGPVGGVAASCELAKRIDGGNVIATDMGGTSFDIGVVAGCRAMEVQMSTHERYRVLVPAVEVTSIGAGGGSIASLDPITGILRVGPQSAGSKPGPVCYGFGGNRPTVTDANAVLGRLNPSLFFAGRHRLDVDLARRTIDELIATPLGVSPEVAAMAIIDIVDSRMADLIRKLTIERGLDPREFTIVAYGGGGPLHVGGYGREIGCRAAIIPRAAPVYSAWGITESPILKTYSASSPTILPSGGSAVRGMFADLRLAADHEDLSADRQGDRTTTMFLDMRYRYQLQELGVRVTEAELERDDIADLLMDRFELMYEDRFGKGTTFRGAGIEISTFRLVLTDSFRRDSDVVLDTDQSGTDRGERDVWFRDGFVRVPIHDSDSATVGERFFGPCMLEGRLMTAVIHPGQQVEVDARGDFVISSEEMVQ